MESFDRHADSDRVEVACAACGAINRFPRARAAEGPRCGRCKAPLSLSSGAAPRAGTRPSSLSAPVEVTDGTWASEVERSPVPVLVDFWAPWCGPCRAVAPVLDALAREYAGRVKIAKVNVDENPQLASRFGVQAIPTMLLVRDGRVVDQQRGALPRQHLERWMQSAL